MNCVMGDSTHPGKELKLCLSRPWEGKTGDCNSQCPNVNRTTVAAELRQTALRKCKDNLETCLKNTGNDDKKILLCRGEEAACIASTTRFELH